MRNEEIKRAVKETYGRIAREGSSCCGSTCGDKTGETPLVSIAMNEKYDDADEQIIAAADLGLGCGTPSAFADLAEGMTVLDLGSGAGIDVFLAAKQVGPSGKAIGLDMTDEMLQKAHANMEKLGIRNAEFLKGDIENMPLASDSIDYIISNCVLNLVPDKKRAFREMYRVLRPEGKFTISDIVTDGTHLFVDRENMHLWASCIGGAIPKDEYLNSIREAGFTQVEVLHERPYVNESNEESGVTSITVSGTK